jgi:hypothetical protein
MAKIDLDRYLDAAGRLTLYPKRGARRRLALLFLASKVEPEREYSEAEINALLRQHHTFDDPALLRRELFEAGFLDRTPDGSRYWLADDADARDIREQ